MIGKRSVGKASLLFLLLLGFVVFIATYNLVTMVLHHQRRESRIGVAGGDPVTGMPADRRGLGRRPFHVAVTATSAAYSKWQCRLMYYWYKKMKDGKGSEMGGFTRVLHSGKPDSLMDEIPTFVVDPLPAGADRGYIVLNRPWAFVQWLEKATIPEEYILMAEPDHVFVKPLPNLARDNQPVGFPFFYIKPTEHVRVVRKFFPEEKGPLTNIDPIGNSPVIIKKSELEKIAPTWMNVSLNMKEDPETDKAFGWVLEMYAYAIASSLHGVRHNLRRDFMIQPPWDLKLGNTYIIHFTYGCDYSLKGELTYGKIGEWRFDKRSYLRGPPPRNLSLPPPGVPESVVTLVKMVNEASANIPGWDDGRDHELTTDEIKSLCEDLYVLDKKSFKQLLKWRIHIRNALAKEKMASSANEDKVVIKEDEAEEDEQEDEDDKVLNEMEELSQLLDKKKKKAKKLLSKRRAKDKARKAMGTQIDATEDSYFERDLFSLSAIKGKKELLAIDSTDLNDDYGKDNLLDSDDEETRREIEREDSSDEMDSDEEHRRYNEQLEEELDEAYERYVIRKGGSTKERKRAKRTSDDLDLIEEGNDDVDLVHPAEESDHEQNKESNPLMVPIVEDEQPTEEQIVERWFSQDVFTEAATDGMLDDSESDEEKGGKIVEVPEKSKGNIKQLLDLSLPKSLTKSKNAEQDGFEIVPAEPMETSDDSSSSDESEDMDVDTKAEILAYAKKMLRKKQREQILDDAYNRYMFDDEGLPKWFVDEEMRHCQSIKPITREEVAAMRAQFREIDARPAKKVAEAKARKKRAAMRKLEKARQKANSIVDQTDISERSKRKMIDQIYKKAAPKKPQKEYVVAKKGVRMKLGKGQVLVDRRMKKDARSHGSGKPGKGSFKKGNKATKGKKPQKGKQSAKTKKAEKQGKGRGRKLA